MISHLDEVKGFMKELSPELGVTDPVSGYIVACGAERLSPIGAPYKQRMKGSLPYGITL